MTKSIAGSQCLAEEDFPGVEVVCCPGGFGAVGGGGCGGGPHAPVF